MKKTIKKFNDLGSAIVWIIVAMSAMSIVVAASKSMTTNTTFSHVASSSSNNSGYIAEAAANYIVSKVVANASDPFNGKTLTMSNGDRSTITITSDALNVYIQSVSEVNRGSAVEGSAKVKYRLSKTTGSLFSKGAFGDVSVALSSNAYVDSYNSSTSPWTGEGLQTSGDVGVNSVAGITKDVTSDIYGAQTTSAAKTMTSVTAYGGAYGADIETTVAKGPGTFYPSRIRLDNETLTINGAVTLYTTELELKNNAKITLAVGATLKLYINGNARFEDTSSINLNGTPSNVAIYGMPTINMDVRASTVKLYAAIYAPDSTIDIANGEVFGSIVADRVIASGGKIHYDTALQSATFTEGTAGTTTVVTTGMVKYASN